MSLKQRTVSAMFWSFIDSFANQGIQFIIGIILARVLSPKDFGLVGMLTIFIAISQTFIDSGFTIALIRKQNCTQTDYSTVFYFNLAVGVLIYLLLFIGANPISIFFHEPKLKALVQVLGLGLVLNSFAIIQKTILSKEINFKLQTRVSVIASVASGIIAVSLAYSGYGVWSLVALTLVRFGFSSILLWIWAKWRPLFVFSMQSFRELFSFGSKLLASGLIDTIYRNIYYLVIGKYFSAVQLGYYTTADQYQALPSQNLVGIIGKVSYPVLATLQNDVYKLKATYQKLIKSTMLITFVLLMGMAVIAKPLIVVLIGIKWLPAVKYLQLLSFIGMLYPLHALNLNMLQVQGRSDLFLRLEIIKKVLAIPTIVIGVFFGITYMIVAIMVLNIIAYFINSFWSGRFISYSIAEQLKDLFPSFLMAIVVNGIVFLVGMLIHASPIVLLLSQIGLGSILTILLCELFKINDYLYLKQIIIGFLYRSKL